MALDTRFWRKKCFFPLPWVVLIRTIKWAAMAIYLYAGFLGEELLSISNTKIKKILNIYKMPTVLVKWGRTGLDYPYIIT